MGHASSPRTSTTAAAVLWEDDGSTVSWEIGGNGGTFNSGPGTPVTEWVADPLGIIKSQNVLKQTVTGDAACRQFRWRDSAGNSLPTVGWYSSWMYIPETEPVGPNFWNVWQFKTNPNSDTGNSDPKITMEALGGSSTALVRLCDTPPGCASGPQTANFALPEGRWFSLEFRVDLRRDSTGRVTVYRDGVEVANVTGSTAYPCVGASCNQWSLNNYSDATTGSIYHGLARISATRSLRGLA